MSRIAWTSLVLLWAAVRPAAAQGAREEVFMLDELSITGKVREPAVAIISSRMQPEIKGFRLEKSFFDQLRSPDEELVDLDRAMAQSARIVDRDALLSRARRLQSANWPLKGGTSAADEHPSAGEGQSGH